ncbi:MULTISPECIES: MHJ_0274 family protein [unclassified Mycoplasma]|uniref:MHJ_0274 family protein n=1 Tax=unclassified Mycoplasma TaxID=2683645 RepID=UPI00211C2F56|nr:MULTISPECIES: hypothetical protein [unclassified Mycoplasma]UUM19703.1 hypothetical protein NPA11_02950 [Mycoplasma sp. 1578d]UUM24686.1 hypothetical protein NPA12_03245 [Mycoplasma sp. 3686d]
MGDIFIWIVFGALVSLVAGFFLFKTIKDKIDARKEKKLLEQFKAEAKEYSQTLIISINRLIELNEEELENFKVSIGDMKMKDINAIPIEYLNHVMTLDRFKRFVLPNPEMQDFVKNLNHLKDIKPNSWMKKCSKEIYFFKEQAKKAKELISEQDVQKEVDYLNQHYAFEKRKLIERR